MLRQISIGLAGLAFATASVAQAPSIGTRIAECTGEYDYASLLLPSEDGLGLDTEGVTVFGAPVTNFSENYSDEWDEVRYVYTSSVALDYPTLRQRATAAHGIACSDESTAAGSRSCAISIPKPKSDFYSVTLQLREDGGASVATCTLNLAS